MRWRGVPDSQLASGEDLPCQALVAELDAEALRCRVSLVGVVLSGRLVATAPHHMERISARCASVRIGRVQDYPGRMNTSASGLGRRVHPPRIMPGASSRQEGTHVAEFLRSGRNSQRTARTPEPTWRNTGHEPPRRPVRHRACGMAGPSMEGEYPGMPRQFQNALQHCEPQSRIILHPG